MPQASVVGDHRFDELLMTMAGQAGSLENLFGIFFSFLHRHTDFYVIIGAQSGKATMGFPEGKAEKLLMKAFKSFPFRPYVAQTDAPSSADQGSKDARKGLLSPNQKNREQSAVRERGPSIPLKLPKPDSDMFGGSVTAAASTGGRVAEAISPSNRIPSPADSTTSTRIVPPSSTSSHTKGAGLRVRYTDDGKQIPLGNGGVTSRYYWTQTITEATVYVDVPDGTRSRDVSCEIGPRRLRLAVRGAGEWDPLSKGGEDGDVIIDGEMPTAVSREDSMWSLTDGSSIAISLEKTKRAWWPCLVQGDPEIDTTMVSKQSDKNTVLLVASCLLRRLKLPRLTSRRDLPRLPCPVHPAKSNLPVLLSLTMSCYNGDWLNPWLRRRPLEVRRIYQTYLIW